MTYTYRNETFTVTYTTDTTGGYRIYTAHQPMPDQPKYRIESECGCEGIYVPEANTNDLELAGSFLCPDHA